MNRNALTLAMILCTMGIAGIGAEDSDQEKAPSSLTLQGATVGGPVTPTLVQVVPWNLPKLEPWRPGDPVRNIPRRLFDVPERELPTDLKPDVLADKQAEFELQRLADAPTKALSSAIMNFDAKTYDGYYPPDVAGDIGPNYFIQATNASTVMIYDKTDGTLAVPEFEMLDLAPAGSDCETGEGDPIVLYDSLADRWVLQEFKSGVNKLCFYVSQTPDPTAGSWYAYEFGPFPKFPDYPHYGVWHDAYYGGANETGTSGATPIYAFDRTNMLAGNAATVLRFASSGVTPLLSGYGFQLLVPADADGETAPPGSSGGIMMRHYDSAAHGGSQDALQLWEVDANFGTSSITATRLTDVNISDYSSCLINFSTFASVPQPGTSQRIDGLREPVMNKLKYRNFGTHEALVGNFVTNTSGSCATVRTGVRWFELRRNTPGSGNWTLYQEGTFGAGSSVDESRFMGGIAMDGSGNIGLGYSIASVESGNNRYPSLEFTGRLSTDTLGVMSGGTNLIVEGVASQVDPGGGCGGACGPRWGDYASMGVDPADDCTFWYTNEYMASGSGSGQWGTRIASFKYDECGCSISLAPVTISADNNGNNRIDVTWSDSSSSAVTDYEVYRSLTMGGPYSLLSTVSDNGGPYTYSDTTVSTGITYYYMVRATDGGGCEADSNEDFETAIGVCTSPPTFAGLSSAVTSGAATCTIDLGWSAAASTCGTGVSYTIWRSTSSGIDPDTDTPLVSGVSGTSYSDADALASGTPYFYIVRAIDGGNSNDDGNTVELSATPLGPATNGTYDDDAESGNITMSTDGSWTISTTQNHTPSGSQSYFSQYTASECSSLYTPSLDLTAGQSSTLTFWTRYDIESGYHGGVVEISTDGGSSWNALTPSGGYPDNFNTSSDACGYANNAPAYGGSSLTWAQESFDLSAYDGQTVQIRWVLSTDSITNNTGWWIDDVAITNVQTNGSCTPGTGCTKPTFSGLSSVTDDDDCADTGVDLAWSTPSDWGESSNTNRRFLVYRGASLIATLGAGVTSYNDNGAADNTSVNYRIEAVNSDDCAQDGSSTIAGNDEVGSAPSSLSNNTAADVDDCADSGVQISWSQDPGDWGDNGNGTRLYDIVRTSPGNTVVCNDVTYGTTSCTDSSGSNGQSYTYLVRYINGCGQSTDTAGASASDEVGSTPDVSGVTVNAVNASACTDTGVDISWDQDVANWNDSGSAGRTYDVIRTSPGNTTVCSGVTYGTTTCNDASGTNGQSYTYSVRYNNSCSFSATTGSPTASDEVGVGMPAITKVTDLSACLQNGVQIIYTGGSGATSHDLYVDGGLAVTGYISGATYPIGNGSSHGYVIRAINASCNADSSPANGTDSSGSAPTFGGLGSATDSDSCNYTGVDLGWSTPSAWNDSGSGSRSIQVYRDAGLIATLGEGATSYTDSGATPDTSHTYSVVAVNGCSQTTGAAPTINATDGAGGGALSFAGLTGVTQTSGASCKVDLDWTAATGGCGSVEYRVYRSTSSGFTPAPADMIAQGSSCAGPSCTWTDAQNVVNGTTYYYIVRAFDGAEDGNTAQQTITMSGTPSTVVLFDDDFEGGTTVPATGHAYTVQNDAGAEQEWIFINGLSHGGGNTSIHFGSDSANNFEYFDDQDDSIIVGCNGVTGDCGTSGMDGIVLPAAASSITMTFWQTYDFEDPYDGGQVLISTTSSSGGFTQIPDTDPGSGAWITDDSYDENLSGTCPPAGGGEEVWSAIDPTLTWKQTTVDLSDLAGQTIWIKFRGITDCSTSEQGWFVDEIHIEADIPGSTCDPVKEVSAPTATEYSILVRDGATWYLYWEEVAGADGYHIYEAQAGQGWDDHTCFDNAASVTSMTGDPVWDGFVRAEVTPNTSSDRYFLVTMYINDGGSSYEGPIGRDSANSLRSNPVTACAAP